MEFRVNLATTLNQQQNLREIQIFSTNPTIIEFTLKWLKNFVTIGIKQQNSAFFLQLT